jgi:hypothetical protein
MARVAKFLAWVSRQTIVLNTPVVQQVRHTCTALHAHTHQQTHTRTHTHAHTPTHIHLHTCTRRWDQAKCHLLRTSQRLNYWRLAKHEQVPWQLAKHEPLATCQASFLLYARSFSASRVEMTAPTKVSSPGRRFLPALHKEVWQLQIE